jgi:hypothetical protein
VLFPEDPDVARPPDERGVGADLDGTGGRVDVIALLPFPVDVGHQLERAEAAAAELH